MVFAPPAAIGGDGRDALRRALDARQPQGGRAVAYSQPVDGGSAPSSRSDTRNPTKINCSFPTVPRSTVLLFYYMLIGSSLHMIRFDYVSRWILLVVDIDLPVCTGRPIPVTSERSN